MKVVLERERRKDEEKERERERVEADLGLVRERNVRREETIEVPKLPKNSDFGSDYRY